MVSIKYVFIVLAADDDGKLTLKLYSTSAKQLLTSIVGEGGTFALYNLLARYANIVRKDPNVAGTVKMERHLTNDLKPMNKGVRSFVENSSLSRVILKCLGVLGVSMVMA